MEAKVHEVNINEKPDELALYNPYNQVPVLVDRDLQIYESSIINEYINDRFPHPQLMPTDIMLRAKIRLLIQMLDVEIFPHLRLLVLTKNLKKEKIENAKQHIKDGLIRMEGIFPRTTRYIVDKELTILDTAIAPLLWRLNHYDIRLPTSVSRPMYKYANRIFERPFFINSLSSVEKTMRP